MSKPLELTGERFGKLFVISRGESDARGRTRWLCLCDCGSETTVLGGNLVQGLTQACNCVRNGKASLRATSMNLKHGAAVRGAQTSEYISWTSMWARCTYPCVRSSEHYLGRGITVCARWESFENFLSDMGPKPTPKHTIDRFPNTDGNYEPGNCRWATPKQQAANKRTRKVVQAEMTL
jgi:hypothetical protein